MCSFCAIDQEEKVQQNVHNYLQWISFYDRQYIPFHKISFLLLMHITGDNQVINCFPDEIIVIFIFLFFFYVTLLKVCICSSLIPSHEQDIVNFKLYIKGLGPR